MQITAYGLLLYLTSDHGLYYYGFTALRLYDFTDSRELQSEGCSNRVPVRGGYSLGNSLSEVTIRGFIVMITVTFTVS